MFKQIMVPVDLENVEALSKALKAAGDLAKHYDAKVHYVGVTAEQPGETGHDPSEFSAKLDTLARKQASDYGIRTSGKTVVSHDPAVELDGALRDAGEEIGADLVVVASHQPGFSEHFFNSNAGYLASHSGISVFVVR